MRVGENTTRIHLCMFTGPSTSSTEVGSILCHPKDFVKISPPFQEERLVVIQRLGINASQKVAKVWKEKVICLRSRDALECVSFLQKTRLDQSEVSADTLHENIIQRDKLGVVMKQTERIHTQGDLQKPPIAIRLNIIQLKEMTSDVVVRCALDEGLCINYVDLVQRSGRRQQVLNVKFLVRPRDRDP